MIVVGPRYLKDIPTWDVDLAKVFKYKHPYSKFKLV
jgi:hypothetical protein